MNDVEGPNENPEKQTSRQTEALIARVLFWGALFSITIAAAGLLIYIVNGGLASATLDLQSQLRRQNIDQELIFVSLPEVARSLRTLSDPLAITALGLLFLLLIPFVTVAILIFAFYRERDYRYSAISAIVLFILFVSLKL